MQLTEKTYTPKQIAHLFKVSVSTVTREVQRGNLAATRIGPRLVRFTPEQITAWLLSRNPRAQA